MKNEKQFEELFAEERDFIHNIASPIAIIQGMIDLSIKSLSRQTGVPSTDLVRLEKALKATDRLVDLIQKHREFLKKISTSQSDNGQHAA